MNTSSITIYVGNLPYAASEEEIVDLFARFGPVSSVKMIRDRDTGRFRGFGFVQMQRNPGELAIDSLNGSEYSGRDLRVNEAKQQDAHKGKPKERNYQPH